MSWSSDDETFRGRRSDVWQAPNFFMELRKGDFEDHAIYLCNLLLGLEIDAYSRVVKKVGADTVAIDGLYAAGEIAGGVHGNNRLGGNSLLDCVVFGRVAGPRLRSR